MIHHGDLFDVLPTLEAESVDACVTDGPYGIGFMGKQWDTFKPEHVRTAAAMKQRKNPEQLASLKNVYGRKCSPAQSPSQVEYDRTLAGQRGFQEWTERWAREVFRVLKPGAFALVCGAPRSYHRMASGLEDAGFEIRDTFAWVFAQGFPKSKKLSEGIGTALKPAYEPIAVARKPCRGSVTKNHAEHGTGGLAIDACRIPSGPDYAAKCASVVGLDSNRNGNCYGEWSGEREDSFHPLGRWPANVAFDDGAAGELELDFPGVSRFFFCPKPSRAERDFGCEHLPALSAFDTVGRDPMSAGANNPRAGAGRMSVLDTSEIVYTDPIWVSAVLARRLPADTDSSRPRVIGASTTQCSDGSVWSMCWCGSPSTDLFHPVVKSIIETETSSITPSRILNSSRRPHTNGCMAAAFGVLADGGNVAAYAAFQSPWARRIGISRKKAGLSTADVVPATSIASWLTSAPAKPISARRNGHPTVKPVELMRWLIRLVTPMGGIVIDPFMGSGTTGMACAYEQRRFIGIEREAEYVAIAERRIRAVAPLFSDEASA